MEEVKKEQAFSDIYDDRGGHRFGAASDICYSGVHKAGWAAVRRIYRNCDPD